MSKTICTAALSLLLSTGLMAKGYERGSVFEPKRKIAKRLKDRDNYGKRVYLITTVDGMQWKIHEDDCDKMVNNWHSEDWITIYPIMGSNYYNYYSVRNLETNEFARVSFWDEPRFEKSHSRTIIDTSTYNMSVTIEKGTGERRKYRVFSKDRWELARWDRGDYVVLGSNNTPEAQAECSFSRILINTRTKKFVRVEPQ